MSIWYRDYSIEEINASRQQTLDHFIGIEFVDIDEESLAATMPVGSRTHQQMGIMHGGASCVLAETVGSVAANLVLDLRNYYGVGLSIHTNHIRSVKAGEVTGRARPQHLGHSTQVWRIEITNEKHQLISSTQLTIAVLLREEKNDEAVCRLELP